MIFTTDHGRGRSSKDWMHHGEHVEGAEETFIALIGPDIGAAGERRNASHVTGQVAEATASATGLGARMSAGRGGEPRYPWAAARR